ncbi:MAG: TlyA family RNA methyltransferase [Candidatus Margulisbacteria bacterium]|jgi:23S rRNA (cytidine1920-2'-O)/16S rRNA (cytidine1409-2'-O)-methyltransferase|nr:TlyA family RNA methyltransferase [Candidatus Margulisiibacteriota bacterium]
MSEKIRLDRLLVEKNLASSREKAQALIIAGDVLVNEQKIQKPGTPVQADCALRLLRAPCPYVSRGGWKLAGALDYFGVDPRGLQALDVGASTGGFTDCLLQRGARQVIALDVGHNQLDWKIRSDQRVIVLEKTNFRYMTGEQLAAAARLPPPELALQLAVADVSFISLEKIFPPLYAVLEKGAQVVALVKPQFEAARAEVGKGGIIKDPEIHAKVQHKVESYALNSQFKVLGRTVSPLLGADGNKEFFIYLEKP